MLPKVNMKNVPLHLLTDYYTVSQKDIPDIFDCHLFLIENQLPDLDNFWYEYS